ncbi:MAG: hypothetical protein OXF11_20840 [Deltaproteobacteria bacterium]|nr:hypothetical protein [Deltaproteobacteria bacterium]
MKRKALIAVVGVFLLGLMGGAVIGNVFPVRELWGNPWRHNREAGKHWDGKKHASSGRYLRMLQRKLDLSERQMAEIGPLLGQARRDLYQARIRSHEDADRIIMEFHKRIVPSLDESQAGRLQDLTDDFRERRAKKRERWMSRLESRRRSD